MPHVDVIVVTRGGGSIEDLWQFNDETLARAIAAQRVDMANDSLARALKEQLGDSRQRLAALLASVRQHRPDQQVAIGRQRLDSTQQRLLGSVRQRLAERRLRLQRATDMLRLLAPQTVLERGFSITTLEDGSLVDSVADVRQGTKILTRLSDGTLRSKVS